MPTAAELSHEMREEVRRLRARVAHLEALLRGLPEWVKAHSFEAYWVLIPSLRAHIEAGMGEGGHSGT